MLIAALCVMAPNWKQPTCPTNGEWINTDTSHIRILLCHKKKQNTATNSDMDKSQKYLLSERSEIQSGI